MDGFRKNVDMVMWVMILCGTLVLAVAGIVFLATRIRKFYFIRKLFGGNRRYQFLLSLAIVIAGSFLTGIGLGMMNLFVVAICLTLIWLLCEGVIWVLRHFFVKIRDMKCYPAGILALMVSIPYLIFGYYTARHVVITEYTIPTEKQVEPLKIVMLSDAHIGSTFDGDGFGRYVEEMNALHPDVVFIAGDFIDSSSQKKEVLAAIRCLERLNSRYGTYFVFGNHDKNHYGEEQIRDFTTEEFKAAFEASGVGVLEDELVQLPGGYTVIGRRDKVEANRAAISELMEQASPDSFVIDINHQPNDYVNESLAGVDLVLSGHTHGGQLRLIRDVGTLIGANDKTYGYEKRGNTGFIVSSGISDWAIDFKTGCVSEIVVISIVP